LGNHKPHKQHKNLLPSITTSLFFLFTVTTMRQPSLSISLLTLFWVIVTVTKVHAWVVVPRPLSLSLSPRSQSHSQFTVTTALNAGGFGGGAAGAGAGGGSQAKTKAKVKVNTLKLKPKAQWDRFLNMKGAATRIRVAVAQTDDSGEQEQPNQDQQWMEVGHIKSKEDAYTALAVARQRALIVDHANRLYPLKISNKKPVLWAYWDEQESAWTTVDKTILDANDGSVPDNLEKIIGFEGKPDPNSGYYCVYNEGRLVNDNEAARPTSKKLK
jgi:hypothetical protein